MLENVLDHDNLKKDAVVLKAVPCWLLRAEPMQLTLIADQMVQLEAAVMKRLTHASLSHDWGCNGLVCYVVYDTQCHHPRHQHLLY